MAIIKNQKRSLEIYLLYILFPGLLLKCDKFSLNSKVLFPKILMVTDFLDFGSFILKNKSLGLNYHDSISCFLENGSLSYRPNRIWHGNSYSCLFGSLMWYPEDKIFIHMKLFFKFLNQISINEYNGPNHNVWALMASNTSNITKKLFLLNSKIERDKRFTNFFSFLDDGYELFWFNGINQKIPILYTSVKQKWYQKEWLETTHRTKDNVISFPGSYAAGTGFICWAQTNFRIFDYFDFWGKSDFDLKFNDLQVLKNGELIPISSMSKQHISMFGCNQFSDHHTVATNLFNMTLEHLKKNDKACGRKHPVKIESIRNKFLFSQRQMVPGYFTIGWLGLFSSSEVKSFTDAWFNCKEGIKVWRWGDQQYVFLVPALFEKYAEKKIGLWPNERVCLPYSKIYNLTTFYHQLEKIKKTYRPKEQILIDYGNSS